MLFTCGILWKAIKVTGQSPLTNPVCNQRSSTEQSIDSPGCRCVTVAFGLWAVATASSVTYCCRASFSSMDDLFLWAGVADCVPLGRPRFLSHTAAEELLSWRDPGTKRPESCGGNHLGASTSPSGLDSSLSHRWLTFPSAHKMESLLSSLQRIMWFAVLPVYQPLGPFCVRTSCPTIHCCSLSGL